MPRTSVLASLVVVLALAAAVVSLVQGWWLGLVWLPMAGIASNVLWMNLRREKLARAAAERA
ncbi:hypothetical protein [Kitasatospora purpeofusca]|uniref:hypothetical protein n=1 Tax=Kitasatospora purpeofusca TaxID=67352 RepID=UPI000A4A3541|nr:hypothetical protein [Kitasatospora purpeofusca]MCX4685266.1 hypothetical protein [Kitasatospora purpeofusca]MCX4752409.1 hypothetical protein [Kitasatospora purpeofusca]WSR31983.1 hypothetical protein OG715_13930 [Kitasatospora purpeofusca]WSR40010.1 hypothetical protein OG196_13405 [Kitasatospora purpeofusca]WTA54212.1 hypothetical protein OIP63_26865 [Kitasatospora purpeofusca]